MTIAAEIGQHLLEANQSLRHAYNELLNSDMTRNEDTDSPFALRKSSAPSTPTKFYDRLFTPLSPSPKKQSFNMSDYVESLERKNHDLTQEVDLLTKQFSQSNRNNQKLIKELENCMTEMNLLKQNMESASITSKQISAQKDDKELLNSYEQLEMEHFDLIENAIMQEKELERVLKRLNELEGRMSPNHKNDCLVHRETQTSNILKSTMIQTVDNSPEKDSISFFKSLAFINSGETSCKDFRHDQLFIPCRFPISPTGLTRSKVLHRDEWIMEIPDEFSIDHLPSTHKPKPAPLSQRNQRLRLFLGQFVNYVYDLIL